MEELSSKSRGHEHETSTERQGLTVAALDTIPSQNSAVVQQRVKRKPDRSRLTTSKISKEREEEEKHLKAVRIRRNGVEVYPHGQSKWQDIRFLLFHPQIGVTHLIWQKPLHLSWPLARTPSLAGENLTIVSRAAK
jgi:hypothetical protein